MFGAADSTYAQLNDFYRFYVVPGAGHCSLNSAQANGPFPQQAITQLIDWVEQGVAPDTLSGTVVGKTTVQDAICLWPKRPQWSAAGKLSCVKADTSKFVPDVTSFLVDF
jgi:tannase